MSASHKPRRRPGLKVGVATLATVLAAHVVALSYATLPRFDNIDLRGIAGPYSFGRFCRPASDELWAVGGGGSVLHTDANGTTEKRVGDVDLNGVYFANSSVGWVVGVGGAVFHTKDGGAKWVRQWSGVSEELEGITCLDDNHCWAVGGGGTILRTVDRGRNWKVLTSKTSTDLNAVTFINERSGWAVGDSGLVLHTSDGGETWEKQRAKIILFPRGPFAAPTHLLAVRFLDENRGWVTGSGGVARTQDGGTTWEAVEVEGGAFIGLVSKDGEVVWAIGSGGTNYRSRNAGLTWESVNGDKLSATTGVQF